MSTPARPSTPPTQAASPSASERYLTSPLPKRQKTTSTGPSSDSVSSTTAMSSTSPAVPNLSSSPALLIKLLTSTAQAPKRGSAFAAGYDIFASEATTVPARGKVLVSTGIAIAVPEGTYGRIAPRSGLASKHHIDTGAGVIDADYRGEVKVLLFNHAETDFGVAAGDRIAQLIIERIYTPDIQVVQELEESVRGAGGFGSTGVGSTSASVPDAKAEKAGEEKSTSGHDSHGAGGAGGIA